mgnify:FL=1
MTAVELSKLEDLKNALQTVKEALDEYTKNKNLTIRDGAIQRFEYTCELIWKTLKERIKSTEREIRNTPKDIFRVAADLGLISDPQVWFDFLTNRNLASHLYDNKAMDAVFGDIPKFVAETEKVIIAIEKQIAVESTSAKRI